MRADVACVRSGSASHSQFASVRKHRRLTRPDVTRQGYNMPPALGGLAGNARAWRVAEASPLCPAGAGVGGETSECQAGIPQAAGALH